MSVNYNDLPLEVWAEKIIPELDLNGTLSFGVTCKLWQSILRNNVFSAEDFDLEGKDITYVFGEHDERPKSLLLAKLKFEKFITNPSFISSLSKMNVFGYTTNDHLRNLCMRASNKNDRTLMCAIVTFDYTTKRLRKDDLESALEIAEQSNLELIKTVIIHPNAKQISGPVLSIPLIVAINTRNQGLVKLLLAHPKAHELAGKSLSKPIAAAIQANETEFALQLLARPAAKGLFGEPLTELLEIAILANNTPVIQAILNLPTAQELLGEELAEPLIAAIKTNNQDIITWLLAHPNTQQILGNGVAEAITTAIEANNQEVLKVLFNFPNAKHIPGYALVAPMIAAIEAEDQDVIRWLFEHPHINEIEHIDRFRSHPAVRRAMGLEIDQAELVQEDSDIEDPNDSFEEVQEGSNAGQDEAQHRNM